MTYENPEDYLDDEEEKRKKEKRWCIEKALSLAEKRKTKEEKTDMDSEDVVNAAKNFNNFMNED